MEVVPLQPLGKEDVKKLETALLVAALFDPEVIEKIKDPRDRVTWVDSLAVAAAAFARRKAGMTIEQIAEEVGRSETTIRNHLEGKTEAGKIIQKVYEKLVKSKGALEIKMIDESIAEKKIERLKEKLDEFESKLKELIDLFDKIKREIE
ncbi:MAG TPA: hypothetical protein EYH22_03660 [Candidatus Nanopusillus sp.]|nr:hypothetical protein [Candidatus Nanopusillus sp.]